MNREKSTFSKIQDAETKGLMVAMTSIGSMNRTELNNQLSNYFRSKIPNFDGYFGESSNKKQRVMDALNHYRIEKGTNSEIIQHVIPYYSELRLFKVTDNLELKVYIEDKYYRDGSYTMYGDSLKYVEIEYFKINENTTKEDVDVLIELVKERLVFED